MMTRLAAGVGLTALGSGTFSSTLTAWRLGFQSALGDPIAHFSKIPIYAPWDILAWSPWMGQVPEIKAGLIIAAVGVLAPVLGMAYARLPKTTRDFGKNEWGTKSDAEQAGLLSKNPSGVILGEIDGQLMVESSDLHTLFAGATGSGKTSGPVICTLLSLTDRSVLVFDPKSELYQMSGKFRSSIGHAFYFDPTERESARYNPLAEVLVGTDREIGSVQNIAELLISSSGLKNSDPFWPITATELLTAIILHVFYDCDEDKRHLGHVRELLFGGHETLNRMKVSRHPESQRIANMMLNTKADKTADNVAATARSSLNIWSDPLVVEKTSVSDFKISDLVGGDHPVSMYLQIPPSDRERLMPLFKLILTQILKSFLYKPHEMLDGTPKKRRLHLVAEEFPSAGKIPGFDQDIRELRGFGVSCMLMCQSLQDLSDKYGGSTTIQDNCHTVTCFASSDVKSMKNISTAIGLGVETKTSTTTNRGGWFSGSRHRSEQRRALMEPGDVRQLSLDESIVLVTGTKPLRAKKVRWYKHPTFKHRGINIEGKRNVSLVQHPEIIAALAASADAKPQKEAKGLFVVPSWSQRKHAKMLFPDQEEAARKWFASGEFPDKHRPFIQHVLATVAGLDSPTRAAFLTSTVIERLRDGEVVRVS